MKIFNWILLGIIESSFIFGSVNGAEQAAPSAPLEEQFNGNEIYALEKFIEANGFFHNYASYRLPMSQDGSRYHSANPDMIETLSKFRSSAFYDSLTTPQLIRYERPGNLIIDDVLHGICAEFRASKPSIDSAAFTKSEKFAFIDKISEYGFFYEPTTLKPSKKGKKCSAPEKDLDFRAIMSSAIAFNHFCRDAIRIVADVLTKDQIFWLLQHSTAVIIFSPQILNQIEDFSMFSAENVVDAHENGHYDWFKNEKALKTLTIPVLHALVAHLRYDLSKEQFEALIAVRPVEELFQHVSFFDNPFAWQLTTGTDKFMDEHLHIDGLIEIFHGSPAGKCSEDLKEALFGYYCQGETSIVGHINGLICGALLKPIPEYAAAHREIQRNLVNNHLSGLELIFNHRKRVQDALKLKSDDETIKGFIEMFETPSIFVLRNSMAVLGDFRDDFTKESTVDDLIEAIERAVVNNAEYFVPGALILAFIEVTEIAEIPYSSTWDVLNTLEMLHLVRKSTTCSTTDTIGDFVFCTKWHRSFFLNQAFDFRMSNQLQLDSDADTLNKIFNGFMIFCNLGRFDERFINDLRKMFPADLTANLLSIVESYNSVRGRYDKFRRKLISLSESFHQSRKDNMRIEVLFHAAVLLGCREAQIASVLQNSFTIDMIELLRGDEEALKCFGEFAHLLSRAQVAELLKDEAGRLLLANNRELLYNLPTYEDFKFTDIPQLKFQAQYATMLRTLPMLPLIYSLRLDNYVINDANALAWRLDKNILNQSEFKAIAWRLVPSQMLSESTNDPDFMKLLTISNTIQPQLQKSGWNVESIKLILQWTILQELKFLETFTLLNLQDNSKWQDAVKASHFSNKVEQNDRTFLLSQWLMDAAYFENIQKQLCPEFLRDLLEVLGGPLSQVRAGIFLSLHGIMNKNPRMLYYSYEGFLAWSKKIYSQVKLKPIKIDSPSVASDSNEKLRSQEDAMKYLADNIVTESAVTVSDKKGKSIGNVKHVSESEEGRKIYIDPIDASYTNIPQYREAIEADVKHRQETLLRLLDEVNCILKIESKEAQLWRDRIKLMGILSADCFTLSPSYTADNDHELNLPLHETLLHKKLIEMTRNFCGKEFSDPMTLATTTIQFNKRPESSDKVNDKDNNTATTTTTATATNNNNNNKKKNKRK